MHEVGPSICAFITQEAYAYLVLNTAGSHHGDKLSYCSTNSGGICDLRAYMPRTETIVGSIFPDLSYR